MDWSSEPYSKRAVGDSGPWGAHVPRAWAAVADPEGRHPAPPQPALMRSMSADFDDGHAELIAFWGPLLPLLLFGLGWARPDLGLQRWYETGRPGGDPILALVDRWWGPYVPDVLAWPTLASAGQHLPPGDHVPSSREVDPKWHRARRDDPLWKRAWGGGHDSMHLHFHAQAPVWSNQPVARTLLTGSEESARAVLVCEAYEGWYRALAECGLTQTSQGRSWRVDVVVKPLGWLGTYRLSRETGVWFSGQHRWHMLGW